MAEFPEDLSKISLAVNFFFKAVDSHGTQEFFWDNFKFRNTLFNIFHFTDGTQLHCFILFPQ